MRHWPSASHTHSSLVSATTVGAEELVKGALPPAEKLRKIRSTLALDVSIPGLRGAETPTPSTTPGCQPRKAWKLRYTVQRDDALVRIADRYNTSTQELVAANCLNDPNVIVIGQELRVPGDVQPVEQI